MKFDIRERALITALLAQTELNTRTLSGEKADTYWDISTTPELLTPYRELAEAWLERYAGFDPICWPPERAATELATNIKKTPILTRFNPPSRIAMARVFVIFMMLG